jgi:hypothetical protein
MIDNFASAIIKWFQNRLRLIYLAIAACENSCGATGGRCCACQIISHFQQKQKVGLAVSVGVIKDNKG